MARRDPSTTIGALLEHAGTTYAEEAGIRLRDAPGPLYQLSVLVTLLSARIDAGLAVSGARALFDAGATTVDELRAMSDRERSRALDEGRYARFDDSKAAQLGQAADLLAERYGGDLRRLAAAAEGDVGRLEEHLQELTGIGPLGAQIYLREAQTVWAWARPYADRRVLDTAREWGLPHSADGLADAAGTDDLAPLAAALTRVRLDDDLAGAVRAALDDAS